MMMQLLNMYVLFICTNIYVYFDPMDDDIIVSDLDDAQDDDNFKIGCVFMDNNAKRNRQ